MNHQLHRRQTDQSQMMSQKKMSQTLNHDNFNKALIQTLCFVLIVWMSDMYLEFSENSISIYRDINIHSKYEPNTLEPWTESTQWTVKRVCIRIDHVSLWTMFVLCAGVSYGKFTKPLYILWGAYFIFRVYIYRTTYDKYPYITEIKYLMTTVQVLCTASLRPEMRQFLALLRGY